MDAIISPSTLGLHSSLPIETVAVRKPLVSLFRHGFLLLCSPSAGQPPPCGVEGPPLSLEVGESTKRGDFEGVYDFNFQMLGSPIRGM
jgi:hypothetical protein